MLYRPDQKKWSELSNRQKAVIVGLAVLQIGLLVAALVDIKRRPAGDIRGSKWMWGAVSLINYFGPVAYFLWGRKR